MINAEALIDSGSVDQSSDGDKGGVVTPSVRVDAVQRPLAVDGRNGHTNFP